ncbi:hypothetical protein BC829DRAFT_293613 [Chytridium lagenaria]|nr:hypothetical protein BC829DRAFT_293613 [Chytridium lagenaria]
MREIERKMTEKSARKGTTRRIHADKLVELETANLSLAIGRIAEVDRKSSEIITGNEIVKDELKEEDNSKEGLPSYAIGSASNASPDAPVPAISTQKCADIEKGALILDSKKDILTQHLESLSGFENVESNGGMKTTNPLSL